MFGMSPTELLIVFLIILLLFGAKRLPELAKSMGKAVREFKDATTNIQKEFDVNNIEEPKREIPENKKADNQSAADSDKAEEKTK
ncbi:MAG: twin-arginine translocase TatA/TatE family subunit [Calditrichia bacterium]